MFNPDLLDFSVGGLYRNNGFAVCLEIYSGRLCMVVCYSVCNLTELVYVYFCRFFAGLCTFKNNLCSGCCPGSGKEFYFFFTVFYIVCSKKHSVAFYTAHLSWSKVCGDYDVLAKEFFGLKVRNKS